MEVVEQVNVDQGVYARLRSLIVERIDAEAALHMKPEELEEQVARTIANAVQTERLFLNGHEQRLLTREIVNDMIRLGPIQGAIDDPEVTDVLINGPDQVLVERRGKLELTSIPNICSIWRSASRAPSADALMNRRRWWMLVWLTAVESTSLRRRFVSTASASLSVSSLVLS